MSIENPFENKIEQIKFEENPFEDETVSNEWIKSVENEKDMARDRQIYPRLSEWIEECKAKEVLEIGSGQGICSSKMGDFKGTYIGIEPSAILVDRAKELYASEDKKFLVGNAYDIPLKNESCDAGFAINVWFHLEDIDKASSELSRILKSGGNFLIITVNPTEYQNWIKSYENIQQEGKRIIGKANTPIMPLSRNTFYNHSLEEITQSLEQNGLVIDSINPFDNGDGGIQYFMQIKGKKIK